MLLLQKIPFWGYDISETKLAKIREKVKNLPNTSVLSLTKFSKLP